MKINRTTIPAHSMLATTAATFDYADSFKGELHDIDNNITSTQIGKAFFSAGPSWVAKLFALRNKIASAFGLKTSGKAADRQEQLNNFTCEPGDQLGLFKVFYKTENEVVLGEDDKHLNFRVSLFFEPSPTDQSKKDITISTTVVFNNWLGKLYFLPVRFFHTFIVPAMLRGIITSMETRKN